MTDWTYTPPLSPRLVVLHEDRDVVVLDKPSGLLSVPGRDPAHADSALARVRDDHVHARAVHRLDLDTSGVMVVALRRKAEAELHRQFRERLVGKRYVARVAGHVDQDQGLIDLPLAREQGRPRSRVCWETGKAARTRYQVVSRDDDSTLLSLSPETGRSHQLRVHLLSLGHPILGDRFYAPPDALARAPRLLLHAQQLSFLHPWSGERMTVEASVPFD
jgi:tRNA pseudouridine32 synthase / 23S rRNA pseudouridine746 synthase